MKDTKLYMTQNFGRLQNTRQLANSFALGNSSVRNVSVGLNSDPIYVNSRMSAKLIPLQSMRLVEVDLDLDKYTLTNLGISQIELKEYLYDYCQLIDEIFIDSFYTKYTDIIHRIIETHDIR